MHIIRDILLITHILAFAGIIGGVLMQLPQLAQKKATINGAILHSSLLLLVSGVALVGMFYARGAQDNLNNLKIGVKTLILVIIVVLALVNKKKHPVSPAVIGTIGGLAVLNTALAVIW